MPGQGSLFGTLSTAEIATLIAIIGGILAAAYTLYKWGKAHGRTEGLIEGDRDARRVVEDIRSARDDAKQEREAARNECKTLQQEINALRSKSPELSEDIKELVAIRSKIAGDDVALWRLHEAKPFPNYKELMSLNRLKVMMVANEKGGVGKTTTVANLAAFFDKKLNKRVLVIDLDLQGSASTTLLQAAGKRVESSLADRLLSGQFEGKWVQEVARDLNPALSRTRVITAIDTLADFEELTKIRWALRIIKEDVRYNLARVLLTQEIQENYDIVLIDVGPRITLGSINALVAATHLIVPTVVDQLSAERVGYFLGNAGAFRDLFNPTLKLAGVIGTMTYQQKLSGRELDVLATIREGLDAWGNGGYIFQRNIPRRKALADLAGNDVAYLRNAEIRSLFDKLGEELWHRVSA